VTTGVKIWVLHGPTSKTNLSTLVGQGYNQENVIYGTALTWLQTKL